MPDINSLSPYLEFVSASTQGRFSLLEQGPSINTLLNVIPGLTLVRSVIRLKRTNSESATYKTLLFAEMNLASDYDQALKWAAYIKDELLGSESADLYLIIHPGAELALSAELCINIEASEAFCRKFVRRPSENLTDFFSRTFLSDLSQLGQVEQIVDPLQAALANTSETFPDFSADDREKWQRLFLSGESGIELIDQLFEFNPTTQS